MLLSDTIITKLRDNLFKFAPNEAFAMVLLRNKEVISIHYMMDYIRQTETVLELDRSFVKQVLQEALVTNADTLIDVHTHPLATKAEFSNGDLLDEMTFSNWLTKYFTLHYYSLVLTKTDYAFRTVCYMV